MTEETKETSGYDRRSFESGKKDGIRRGYNSAIDKMLAEIDRCTELAELNMSATKKDMDTLTALSMLRDFCVEIDQNLYEE
jgi:hypothetical protein